MQIYRVAAFSINAKGGNPAGVVFADQMPSDGEMLAIAKEINYSETAFLVPQENSWRVRYFAPTSEVSFCGHATIASGALLGQRSGAGIYPLTINSGDITVEAIQMDGGWSAALQSPPTTSRPAPADIIPPVLAAFQLEPAAFDPRFPLRIASAGADHLIIFLRERSSLSAMSYPFEIVRDIMAQAGLTTISLLWSETANRFHARNPFAIGGVYEDPATGAAAAALGGYLRDIGWPAGGQFEILQGFDMGMPSLIHVIYGPTPGESIRVSGATRVIEES